MKKTANKTSTNLPPPAEIRFQNGTPTFLLDGKPAAPLFRSIDFSGDEPTKAIPSSPSHLYVLKVPLGWEGTGKYDYAPLEGQIRLLLDFDPEARFLLRVDLSETPTGWVEGHRLDRAVFDIEGDRGPEEEDVSLASQLWRRDAGEAFARLLRHATGLPEGKRLLGCVFTAKSAWCDTFARNDIGPRMAEAFKKFALERYRRNPGLLRKAWFDARADFDAIRCPNPSERARTDMGVFRTPHRSRRLLDFYECVSQVINDAILGFAAIARANLPEGSLVGTEWTWNFGSIRTETGEMRFPQPVIESPDVDLIVSSEGFDFAASLRLHNKFLLVTRVTDADVLANNASVILDDKASVERVARCYHALTQTAKVPAKLRQSASRIAVIVDPSNLLMTHVRAERQAESAPGNPLKEHGNWLNASLVNEQLGQIAKLGTSYDMHLFSDFFRRDMPEYDVYFFLNSLYLSDAERRQLDARVKRGGKTSVFFWGAGAIWEEGVDAVVSQRVTGQRTRIEAEASNLRVRVVEVGDPLTRGIKIGSMFGCDKPVSPTITIPDKSIKRLGGNTSNRTVFSVKRTEEWTSVVFGVTPVPANLLKNVLREAHCHLFADTEKPVYVSSNARYIAISSDANTSEKISLPGVYDVLDGWTGKTIATEVSEFTVELKATEEYLYELRPKRE